MGMRSAVVVACAWAVIGVLTAAGAGTACGGEDGPEVGPVEMIELMSSDGLPMRAEVRWGGETWLLLGHMFTANLHAWDPVAEHFHNRGYSVLTWDFRGHGEKRRGSRISRKSCGRRSCTASGGRRWTMPRRPGRSGFTGQGRAWAARVWR